MDFSQVKHTIKEEIGSLNYTDNQFFDVFMKTHQKYIEKWIGKESKGKFPNHNIDLAAELIICFGKQMNCMSDFKCRSMDEISDEVLLRNQYTELSTYDKTYDRLIWKIIEKSDIDDFITKETIVELFRRASTNGLLNNLNDDIITLFTETIINSVLKTNNKENIKKMFELGLQKENINLYADIYKKITDVSSTTSGSSVIVGNVVSNGNVISNGTVITGNLNVVSNRSVITGDLNVVSTVNTGGKIISGGRGIMITGQKTTNSHISSNAKDCDILILGNGRLTVVEAYLSDDGISKVDITTEIQKMVKDNNIIIKGNLNDITDAAINYNTILHIT